MTGRFWFVRAESESGLLRLGDVERIVAHLRRGGLAALPTETGHLLAALATSIPALHTAFAAKQRDPAHPMHIACASLGMAATYAELTDRARLLLAAFTPGPLSIVVRQKDTLPRELVTLNGTVGIRVPDHPATQQVIAALGAPVTATSLNRSGEESRAPDLETLEHLDWGTCDLVPVVEDPHAVRFAGPSTLVRLIGPEVELLRPGPVGVDALEALAGSEMLVKAGPQGPRAEG